MTCLAMMFRICCPAAHIFNPHRDNVCQGTVQQLCKARPYLAVIVATETASFLSRAERDMLL